MKVDMIVMRHASVGAPHFLAKHIKANIINAGDELTNIQHRRYLMLFPSAKIGCVTGKKIAIIGDILHSRSLFNILRCKNWGKLWSVVR